MPSFSPKAARQNEGLYQLATAFFRLGNDPKDVELVLPNPPRQRRSSLDCANYPLFDHEVSPDDMFSAARVYSLLTACYGEVVSIRFEKQAGDLAGEPPHHRILIGAPYTNRLTKSSDNSLGDEDIRFDPDDNNRAILYGERRYEIEFDTATGRIRRDYCFISRRAVGGQAEFVIAGLRAYGQVASFTFLSESDFFQQAMDLVSKVDAYQILVEVEVGDRQAGPWKIVESHCGGQVDPEMPALPGLWCSSAMEGTGLG